MHKDVIAIIPGDELGWLLDQIEQEKIAQIEARPPADLTLRVDDVELYLSKSCLLKYEVIALLHGMRPSQTGADGSSLDANDNVVVQRLLADEKTGKVAYPMLSEEFVIFATEWRQELPEVLGEALRSHFEALTDVDGHVIAIAPSSQGSERKNASETTQTEIAELMTLAVSTLESAGLECHPNLPGTKLPYCAYLREQSRRLSRLTDSTLHDYLKRCRYRWKQSGGSRIKTDEEILRQLRAQSNSSKLSCTD